MTYFQGIKLNLPELYKVRSFVDWLNSNTQKATWHTKGEPNEYSDVFMTFEYTPSEGVFDCSEGIPEECMDIIAGKLKTIAGKRRMDGLLWITNFEEEV